MSTEPDPPRRAAEAALERRLVTVQAASGATFAIFLVAHLINQMIALAGPVAYDRTMGALRSVYQATGLEIVLVGAPLLIHVVASVWRIVRRRRSGVRPAAAIRSRLQRLSGLVLLIFVFGHVFATRGASLLFDVYPDFDAIAFTMVWTPAYFIPYYSVFAISGLYHALQGVTLALPRLGLHVGGGGRSRWVVVTTLIGAATILLAVARFAGAFDDHRERALGGAYAQLLERLGAADLAELRR
ncbi:MAG: hypothetical protein R3B09_05140 [Nannocystaceae bacterium]